MNGGERSEGVSMAFGERGSRLGDCRLRGLGLVACSCVFTRAAGPREGAEGREGTGTVQGFVGHGRHLGLSE